MSRLSGKNLDAGNAFLFRLVGEHWTVNQVTDSINAFYIRLKSTINYNALLGYFDPEPRPASDYIRDQYKGIAKRLDQNPAGFRTQ